MDKAIKNKKNNQLGLSILEALVATVIVGIGFVAVFQMVQYSTQSIVTSAERTKSIFLIDMIAEDLIGARNSSLADGKKLHENLRTDSIQVSTCQKDERSTSMYNTESTGPANKKKKWEHLLNTDKIVRCRSDKDTKTVKVYTMCQNGCDRVANIKDEKMYIGQVLFNMNNGTKKKFLYFQVDYKLEP